MNLSLIKWEAEYERNTVLKQINLEQYGLGFFKFIWSYRKGNTTLVYAESILILPLSNLRVVYLWLIILLI